MEISIFGKIRMLKDLRKNRKAERKKGQRIEYLVLVQYGQLSLKRKGKGDGGGQRVFILS